MNIQDLYKPLPAGGAYAPAAGSDAPDPTGLARATSTGQPDDVVAGLDDAVDAAGETEYASWFAAQGART